MVIHNNILGIWHIKKNIMLCRLVAKQHFDPGDRKSGDSNNLLLNLFIDFNFGKLSNFVCILITAGIFGFPQILYIGLLW